MMVTASVPLAVSYLGYMTHARMMDGDDAV